MERLTSSYVYDRQQSGGFIQELRIASDPGPLSFDVAPGPPNVGPASADPSVYVQAFSNFALTVTGQGPGTRLGGRPAAPGPRRRRRQDSQRSDPPRIADVITAQYAPDEAVEFLAQEGIPPAQLTTPEGAQEGDVHALLAALGSEGRRAVRQCIGRWLGRLPGRIRCTEQSPRAAGAVTRCGVRPGGGGRPQREAMGGHPQRDHAVSAAAPIVEVDRVDSDGEDGGLEPRPVQYSSRVGHHRLAHVAVDRDLGAGGGTQEGSMSRRWPAAASRSSSSWQ